jgi:hypothetical protein
MYNNIKMTLNVKKLIPYLALLVLLIGFFYLNWSIKSKNKQSPGISSNQVSEKDFVSDATGAANQDKAKDISVLEGRAGYFRWRKDVELVKQGQEFNLDILLVNTPQLDQAKKEGISAAEMEITYDPAQLQAIDLNPQKEGIQAQAGKIFTTFMTNKIDPDNGDIYISAFSMPGGTIYNSNGKQEDEMVFSTVRFKLIGKEGEPIKLTIVGSNSTTDKTNIYTNVQGLTDMDLWNQGISEQGWEL